MDDIKGLEIKNGPGFPARRANRWGLAGAIVAAVLASSCCLLPLVLLLLGVSSAGIGSLAGLAPYRPVFMAVTLGFLGFAFYRVYRKPREVCSPGSQCAEPGRGRFNKILLWVVTGLAATLLAFPYLAPHLLAAAGNEKNKSGAAPASTREVVLKVEGMTCSGCVTTVRKSLLKLEGVKNAKVTLQPPRAVVVYDPAKVTVADMIKATGRAGYPSSIKPSEDEGSRERQKK